MDSNFAGDQVSPAYTKEDLISEGWTERSAAPNKEIIFTKDGSMGFWNEQTGRLVICKLHHGYFEHVEEFDSKIYDKFWQKCVDDSDDNCDMIPEYPIGGSI